MLCLCILIVELHWIYKKVMQYYERLMKKMDYKSSESDGNNGPE